MRGGEGVVLDLNVYGQSAAGIDLKKERVRHSEVEGGARGVVERWGRKDQPLAGNLRCLNCGGIGRIASVERGISTVKLDHQTQRVARGRWHRRPAAAHAPRGSRASSSSIVISSQRQQKQRRQAKQSTRVDLDSGGVWL